MTDTPLIKQYGALSGRNAPTLYILWQAHGYPEADYGGYFPKNGDLNEQIMNNWKLLFRLGGFSVEAKQEGQEDQRQHELY